MTRFVPVSDAFGNKDPVARDIALNSPWAMSKDTITKVCKTLATTYHHTFSGRLGRMVAPIFARASRPTAPKPSRWSFSPRIDT